MRQSTLYIQKNPIVAGTAKREELQITIMLISVIIVFFVCQAPYVIYTAIASINEYSSVMSLSDGFTLFRHITMLLLTLKSAINFIIYCWFSEKFRATLKRLFGLHKCAPERKNSNGSYYNLRRYSNHTRDTTI